MSYQAATGDFERHSSADLSGERLLLVLMIDLSDLCRRTISQCGRSKRKVKRVLTARKRLRKATSKCLPMRASMR